MTEHPGWVADEFLMNQGFTITDPGPGRERAAVRGELVYPLEPRCSCECCPTPNHPNYRYTVGATV